MISNGTLSARACCAILALLALTGGTNAQAAPADWMPARIPGAICVQSMAYDEARERIVMFGGATATTGYVDDTWEWDHGRWILREPAVRPPPSGAHAMAYDSARKRIVLFGGFGRGDVPSSDTWEWDGAVWSLAQPAARPPARAYHAMAYDDTRRVVVLFGGGTATWSSTLFADTWEWDGTSWLQRSPTVSPPARRSHALAYDAARQRTVLFGGSGRDNVPSSDTWEWDGATWTQRQPAHHPAARAAHAMAYDRARQRVVLFAGDNQGSTFADTWEWDGSDWTQRPFAPSPAARFWHAMVYDAAQGGMVVYGGRTAPGSSPLLYFSDTWRWDGAAWASVPGPEHPTDRDAAAMAWDATRQRVVLFGGTGKSGALADTLADTWEWDGARWLQRQTAAGPSARAGAALVHDAARGRVVLFGGDRPSGAVLARLGDTWEWDGSAWSEQHPAQSPSPRSRAAAAWDAGRRRIVLFGGQDPSYGALGDTWEHDGTTWIQRQPATRPPARAGITMAHDAARGRTVMLAGSGSTQPAETWEWDGNDWSQRQASPATGTGLTALTYDATRQRCVLLGRPGPFSQESSTWEWDGVVWTQSQPATTPPGRDGAAIAFDAARGRVVMFGGRNVVGFSDTWLYGSLQRASSASFGQGCGGATVPVLTGIEAALGEDRLLIDLIGVSASAPCVFAFSLGTQALPLGAGCTLYLQSPILLVLAQANASGFASMVASVPLDPALRGAGFHAQGCAFDPSAALGIAFTAGRTIVLGD